MISRVADHCFWFGRYVERAESTARLLQATRTLVFDADIPVTQCWQPLVIVSGEYPALRRAPRRATPRGNGEVVQEYMTWDRENLVSLRQQRARRPRERPRHPRRALARRLGRGQRALPLAGQRRGRSTLYRENREQFYRRVRTGTQLMLGLVRSTMLHDDAR